MPAIPIRVGQNVVYVNGDDFTNGFQAGHLTYMRERDRQHDEDDLAVTMMDALEDMTHPERWNIGYVVGWIVSFALKGEVPK
jgi:hypothetical protein